VTALQNLKQNTQATISQAPYIFWLGLLIIGMAAIALRARLLNNFPLSADEGIHLIWLRLLAAGYQPYSEVYITYPPLYPLTIWAVWSLWPIEAAQRWFSVIYALFGAVGIALIARKFAGPVAGLAAAALALFSPVLIEASITILAEFHSVAWSVWAVWLAWLAHDELTNQRVSRLADQQNTELFLHSSSWRYFFRRLLTRRYILLMLSGLCLGLSLLTKLLSPFIGVLILLIIFHSRFNFHGSKERSNSLFIDLVVCFLPAILVGVIFVLPFNFGALAQQVVEQRLGARTAAMAEEAFWPPRYEHGIMFVQEDTAMVVLGLVGLGLALKWRCQGTWLILTWLLLALAMLAVHNPLRYKHLLILIPPLAILGGAVIGAVWSGLKTQPPASQSRRWGVMGLALLVGLYMWQIPAALTLWQTKANIPQPPLDEVEALAFIQEATAPGDCLITDDMPLLYWSGRMTPPELAEVSTNRLASGALTSAELMALTDRYDCQVVAAVSNRIPKYLPDYLDWVKSKYLGRFHYGEDDLYFAKIDTQPRPAVPLQADFDGQVRLRGYGLPSPAHPGNRIPLSLIWQAQTRPDTNYAIFVQLRDTANNTLASADHQPYKSLLPTSKWPQGAVIQEVTWLQLPTDIPPGQYNLYVGLYRPDTLERLPLQSDTSGENAVILGPLEIR
jgi:4-amino-4-deoxy-L-arabinose transferase-like glycosyltransferase